MMSKKKPTPRVVSTKPLPGAGSQPTLSAKIGGVGNATSPSGKKGK